MKNLIFSTAGHVDHGKTTLVKHLTGIDTDRLPEEKKRGLTIDIGFAYLFLKDKNTTVEIIDVPGHERFVKNAVAGIAPARCIILTVDAVEGIMPQTVEHTRIALVLGISHFLGVITKADRVSDEELAEREKEVSSFLEKFGVDFEVARFSPFRHGSDDKLLQKLSDIADRIEPYDEKGPLKILIDGSFTVKGFGTVVRGSLVRGAVEEGQTVAIQPSGKKVRIRKLQNHGRFINRAVAGQRVALNLAGVKPSEVKRGFWITSTEESPTTKRAIVKTDLPLRAGGVYPCFSGLMETSARVRPVRDEIFILTFSDEVILERNERLLILSPQGRPVGGALVLHPSPATLNKKFIIENLDLLEKSIEEYTEKEDSLWRRKKEREHKKNIFLDPDTFRKIKDLDRERIMDEKELLESGLSKDEIRRAVRERVLHRLEGSMLITDSTLRLYEQKLRESGEPITIQKTKEMLNLSRRQAVALLEYFDYLALTVREGNLRRWKGRG